MFRPSVECFLPLRPVARVESERRLFGLVVLPSIIAVLTRRPHQESSKQESSPGLLLSEMLQVIRSSVTSYVCLRRGHRHSDICVIQCHFAFQSLSGLLLFLCLKMSPQINSPQSTTLRDVISLHHFSL